MMKQLLVKLLIVLICGSSYAAQDSGAPQATGHEKGKLVFDKWCAMCHAAGERMPGTASLQAKYNGSLPAALEERKDMPPDFVRYFVRHGVMIMPSFRKSEITDAELDALSSYLGNKK